MHQQYLDCLKKVSVTIITGHILASSTPPFIYRSLFVIKTPENKNKIDNKSKIITAKTQKNRCDRSDLLISGAVQWSIVYSMLFLTPPMIHIQVSREANTSHPVTQFIHLSIWFVYEYNEFLLTCVKWQRLK